MKRPEDETEEEKRINDIEDPDGTRFLPPVPNHTDGLALDNNWERFLNPENVIEGEVHPLRQMENNIQSSRNRDMEKRKQERMLLMTGYRGKLEKLGAATEMDYKERMRQLDETLTLMQSDGLAPDSNLLQLIESVMSVGANDSASGAPPPKATRKKTDDGKLELAQLFANPPAPKVHDTITHKLSEDEAKMLFAARMSRQRRR